MTRRRAALLAAVVAVLLGATYLLTRRNAQPALPELVPTAPEIPVVPPSPRETAESADDLEPVAASAPVVDAPTAELTPPTKKAEPRSWGGSRAVPARTPPPAPAEPAATAGADAEQPLPTWVRVGIVAAALVAFFAVSLIATKQV